MMNMRANNKILNWQETLVMCNHKEDLARDLINMLESDLKRQQQSLNAAFRKYDIMEMRSIVHQIQGGCSYISLPKLKEASVTFQKQLHSEAKNLESAYQEMDRAINEVLKNLPFNQ